MAGKTVVFVGSRKAAGNLHQFLTSLGCKANLVSNFDLPVRYDNCSEPDYEVYLHQETMAVPPWLEKLLSTSFFNVCRIHGDGARSECNMYCLDCNANAFCSYCRSSIHRDHQVIQIRRSSYHDVVRISEIQKVVDVSEVQTYVVNSDRVLFLNERPHPKGGKSVTNVCEICGRGLLDSFRFCSLGCKLVGIKNNGNGSLASMQRGEGTSSSSSRGANMSSSSSSRDEEEGTYSPKPLPCPSRSRRKGIPRRASF